MISVLALFERYEDCKAVVDRLMVQGFDEQHMNVIVDEEVAKTHFDVSLQQVDVKATDELGERRTGLDILLGTEQPIDVPWLGAVYAAGELATILVKTAAAPDTGGLKDALVDLDVSEPTARRYVEGILAEGLLFWIRTDDERASEAVEILREHNGRHVTSRAS